MKVIRPNCRAQFTTEDFDFVMSVLSHGRAPSSALARLLSDTDARDEILDDDELFHAILERPDWLTLSQHLYFYLLVRHALREAGITSRVVADYVAELLAEFCNTHRAHQPLRTEDPPMEYLVDMVAALQEADDHKRFVIRAHMGNFSLFLAGVFPDHIRRRVERRAAPALTYYESIGSASFHAAGNHRLARRYELEQPLLALAEAFHTARLALNDLTERLLDLGKPSEFVLGKG